MFCKIFQKIRTQNLTGASGDRRLFGKRYKKVTPKLDKPNTRFPLFVGSHKIFKKRFTKLDKPSDTLVSRERARIVDIALCL